MRKNGQMAEINVVPYIDVMLVLLVIFMIATPLLTQGVDVELPNAAAKSIESKAQEPIIVTVDQQGLYYLNLTGEAPLDQQQLLTRVAAELQIDEKNKNGQAKQILVKGDARVDYGKVVQAMVLLQKAGAQSVGLMTQPDEVN